jgi:hypothetical protein
MRKGSKQQTESINVIKSKLLFFGYGIIEAVQQIVERKDTILKTSGNLPFLENACCNESLELTNPMQYFYSENDRILDYIRNSMALSKLLTMTKDAARAPMLFHNSFTGIRHSTIYSNNLDDIELIYSAIIYYCNFDKKLPIPEKYKEICNNQHQKWYSENKDKKAEYQKEYNEQNAENRRQYQTKRRLEYPYLSRWRSLLRRSKNGIKSKTTQDLLGYSAKQLKEYLDKQGMDWSKHHIDHKIPLSWFKNTTPPHIVNDLRNLHPSSPEENKSKSNIFGDPVPLSYIYDIEQHIKNKYKNKLWELGHL